MSRIVLTRPEQGNLWYPLPHDYNDLTEDGQKKARVWAVSRDADPEQFVESWALLRELYLKTLPHGRFYRHKLYPSPPAHYDWVRDFWRYNKNAFAAPRASAKSTVLGKELVLLLLLTRPYDITTLALASQSIRQERFEEIMTQLTENPHILNDFGQMKPSKGTGIWNHEYLKLANGAILQGVTVDGRKRGARPHHMIMDDPEYDPQKDANDTEFLKKAENLIFEQMLPMLEEDGHFLWIGTMVSRRSALWNACMSDDPRFRFWNRRVYSMVTKGDDGTTDYFWKAKWDATSVQKLQNEMGKAAFEKEYQNNPVANSARLLILDETFGTYARVSNSIQYMTRSPDGTSAQQDEPYDEWLRGLSIVVTVDPSISESLASDHSAIVVTGIDADRNWWVLDLYLGNWVANSLVQKAWDVCEEWNADILGIESVGLNATFVQAMENHHARSEGGYRPKLWKIKYPSRLSKSERISAISPRFARHSIRLPSHLRGQFPWRELFYQIEYFTMDLSMLPRDDALDALSMVQYCPGVSGGRRLRNDEEDDSYWGQVMAGRTLDMDTGLPLSQFLDPAKIAPSDLREMFARRTHLAQEAASRDAASHKSRAAEILRKRTSPLTTRMVK